MSKRIETSFLFLFLFFSIIVKYVHICNPVLLVSFITLSPLDEQLLKDSVFCLILEIVCFLIEEELIAEYTNAEPEFRCETLGLETISSTQHFYFQRENCCPRSFHFLSPGTLSGSSELLQKKPNYPPAHARGHV